jgi:hypothetical protein
MTLIASAGGKFWPGSSLYAGLLLLHPPSWPTSYFAQDINSCFACLRLIASKKP